MYTNTSYWRTFVAAHVVLWRYLITKASALQDVTYKAASVPLGFVGKQSVALQERIKSQLEQFLDGQMDQLGDKFKTLIKDPYMPATIRASIDDFVDVVLPDLKLALFTKTNEYINYRSPVSKMFDARQKMNTKRRRYSSVGALHFDELSFPNKRDSGLSMENPDDVDYVLDSLVDDNSEDSGSDSEMEEGLADAFLRGDRSCSCCQFPNRATLITFWFRVRSWVLYTTSPFDRSIWRNMRNPNYLVLQMVGLIPGSWIPGVGFAWWMFVFMLHDKKDEYQLSQFIVGFQTAKFFSQGMFSLLRGAFLYYMCATVNVPPNCEERGPQARHYFDTLFFFLQILLVWSSFFILPFTLPCRAVNDPKDLYLLDEDRSDRHQTALRAKVRLGSGGRLNVLLYWHSATFIFISFLGTIAYIYYEQSGWQFRSTCYWLETLYGLSALPFVPFKVPIMGSMLTPTKATGYTRDGITVIRVVPPPPEPLLAKIEKLSPKSDLVPMGNKRRASSRRFFITDEYEARLLGKSNDMELAALDVADRTTSSLSSASADALEKMNKSLLTF